MKFVVAGIAVLCFVSAHASAPDEREVFRERLLAMQADEHEDLVRRGSVITDPALNLYVRKVMARVSPRQSSDMELVIVRDHDVTAWVDVGGRLHITSALLATLSNEDQLAFIIGHEMEHVRADHALSGLLERKKRIEEARRWITESTLNALARSAAFSREQEISADTRAIEMLANAGYSPQVGIYALYRLAEIDAAYRAEWYDIREHFSSDYSRIRDIELSLRTHPDIVDRYDSARSLVKEKYAESSKDVTKEDYWRMTKSMVVEEAARSRETRDGSRLRVYLTGDGAKERFGADYFFWMTEAFRLDGSKDERAKLGSIQAAIIKQYPAYIPVLREHARLLDSLGHVDAAKSLYQVYMSGRPASATDVLDFSIGQRPATQLEPMDEELCPSDDLVYELYELEAELSLPCDWRFISKGNWHARASRNSPKFEEAWIYYVSDTYGYVEINEKIDEDSDISLAERMEMHRADLLKTRNDEYRVPGNSGVVRIGDRNWAWFDYIYTATDGVHMAARRYITPVNGGSVGFGYVAIQSRYYDKYFPAAERILRSISIEDDSERF